MVYQRQKKPPKPIYLEFEAFRPVELQFLFFSPAMSGLTACHQSYRLQPRQAKVDGFPLRILVIKCIGEIGHQPHVVGRSRRKAVAIWRKMFALHLWKCLESAWVVGNDAPHIEYEIAGSVGVTLHYGLGSDRARGDVVAAGEE